MGWKNFDKNLIQIGSILEAYYPERVGNIIIMDPDWLFWLFWKITKPLLPTATAQKVCYSTQCLAGTNVPQIIPLEGNPTESLLKLADKSQLWTRYGGEWKAPSKRRKVFGIEDYDEVLIWKNKKK